MKHANDKVDIFVLRFNQIEKCCQGFEDMQSKIKDEVMKHMGAIPNLSEDVSKLMKASYGLDVPKIVKDEVVKHMEAIPNIANEVTELMKSARSLDIPKLIDDRVIQSLQDSSNAVVQQVIQRVMAIEMTVASLPSSSSSQSTSYVQGQCGNFQKVLLEYTAVNNLKVLGSAGVKFKEWDEKLVNILGQSKSGSKGCHFMDKRKEGKEDREE
jgi:hypothetical protein